MFLGTPGFMAPEQIKGDDASAATDRYAFSVLALELLSGRRPFNADSTPALLYKIVHEPPDIAAELAPALRRVFERALAKDPAVRFADLRSFLLALVDAATLAESRRATLRALIGTSDTVDLDRTHVSDASTVGATVATAARPRQKAVLREGVSGRSIGRVLAGAGVVAGAGIGVALWLARHDEGPKPTPAAPAVVQATAAPQRAAVASPAVLAAPAASPTAPSVAVAPATPLAAAGAPTATPVAAAAAPSDAPVAAAVAPTASPRAVVAVAPVEPTAAPARRAGVPDALAPVAAPTGARRAPQPTAIAKRTKRDGNAAAPARAAAPAPASPPAAQAAPVWGEIRSEGAQRTD
jgi:serine/threonine-protein kinase